VREALFSTFGSLGAIDDAVVLDLYAGSGALGLEAVSRGAREAVLVERSAPAAADLRENVRAVGLPARVVVADVTSFLTASAPVGAHLVLIDPPYDLPSTDLDAVLGLLVAGHVAPDGVVAVERDRRAEAPSWPAGLVDLRTKSYGDTVVYISEFPGDPATVEDTMETDR
jgi:16S rRNA (guanine966-N2)-methyltransferase